MLFIVLDIYGLTQETKPHQSRECMQHIRNKVWRENKRVQKGMLIFTYSCKQFQLLLVSCFSFMHQLLQRFGL